MFFTKNKENLCA